MAKTLPDNAHAHAPSDGPGWIPAGPVAGAALYQSKPGDPWYYAHHPSRWFVAYDQILPDLIQLDATPGVNGTGREIVGGGGNPTGLLILAQKRGLTVIEPRDVYALIGCSYIRPHDVAGGRVFLAYEEIPVVGTRHTKTDHAARLRILVAIKSLLPAPAEWALDALRERLTRDHAAACVDADRHPDKARTRDDLAAQLAILARSAEPTEQTEPTEPENAPKGRR